ncbi:salivary glue protein Sgs-3-like [Cylas formicarius]|uniref:salivary glue protein Sgs-3-like n=1 Tax=Cylas formicarius TaxID=197179 RepID=UPI0029586955|nr:salivary glue protein Sgs-3-like [Cylas formicarius]
MNSVLVIICLGTLAILADCMVSTNRHQMKEEPPCMWIFWRPRRPATTTKPPTKAQTPSTPSTATTISPTTLQTADSTVMVTTTLTRIEQTTEAMETTTADISDATFTTAAPTTTPDAEVVAEATV